jgi:KUP system potassium uptake protein
MSSDDTSPTASKHPKFLSLCLAALGIVYGDIGTSPLYALRECFGGAHIEGLPPTPHNIMGLLSLIFWSFTITITLKYVVYVLHADNDGEGGGLALMALAHKGLRAGGKRYSAVLVLGLMGAALLYGDGMITPAISVLSAVEGLHVVAPTLDNYILPITVGILVLLFVAQNQGTARVASIFGPVTLIWFLVLAALGILHIVQVPQVLGALSPHHAVRFFMENGSRGILALGSVFLVVTGGEALYADLGHFGKEPIRLAWYFIVMPALVVNYLGHFGIRPIRATWLFFVGPALMLNYLGQGALLIQHPEAVSHPFFEMAPRWALIPLVVLSTIATIIASQALISGAFSMTGQAVMLGILPRVNIRHTSESQIGQIYVPFVNWGLMLCSILLVLSFRTSSALAAAYGIAVATTMLVTTALAHVVARKHFGWGPWKAGAITTVLLLVDIAFFSANVPKIPHGGWVPLVIAVVILVVMLTWKKGRGLVAKRINDEMIPLEDFFEIMRIERPARVPGTAVFMASNAGGAPLALMHNFSHNRVVHQQVILITVITRKVPWIKAEERLKIEPLRDGFVRVVASYGFMEVPDLRELLTQMDDPKPSLEYSSFFLGRESLRAEGSLEMARWRKLIYMFLARNAAPATTFYKIPADRVVELGGTINL